MSTTEISRKLKFTVSVSFLKRIGFVPEINTGRAKYWKSSEYEKICDALISHINIQKDE